MKRITPYKQQKQYRIPNCDYSEIGEYFVTICTKDRKNLFGKILKNQIYLSKIGEIVKDVWSIIPKQFPDVVIDKWVIMPNHLHGIIVINKIMFIYKNLINQIPTDQHNTFKSGIKNNPMELEKITLGRIIRWFKGLSTYKIHKTLKSKFSIWQPRYFDYIIRDEKTLDEIREYIELNPFNCDEDRNSLENMEKWTSDIKSQE